MNFPIKALNKKPFPRTHRLRDKKPLYFDDDHNLCFVLKHKLIITLLNEKEDRAEVIPDDLNFLRLSLPSMSGQEHKDSRAYYFDKINECLFRDFSHEFEKLAERNIISIRRKWLVELNKDLVSSYVFDCICLIYGIRRNAWDRLIQLIPSSDLEVKKNMILDALDEQGLLYQICFTNNDWSLEKQLAECNLVLTAGKENIIRSLMNLIPFFLSDTKARQMLGNPDYSIEKLVIEALRLQGPLWIMTKSYATDIHLMNHFIPKDYRVKLCVFAGNRDGEVFENPDSFDPTRKTQPLLYGRGLRRCPGEKIANQIIFAFFNVFHEHLAYVKTFPLDLTKKHVGKLGLIRAFETYHVRMV